MISTTEAAARDAINTGQTALGIEFGSTRIKAVLTGPGHAPIAVGAHDWDNEYRDQMWTYSEDAIWAGLAACYADLAGQVSSRYGVELRSIGAIGISAMMHGYLAFNDSGDLLVPFRTWRNTNTGTAAVELSTLFEQNIPQRWSIAHLHQAILNAEPHLSSLAQLNTLAGYVHYRLTGHRVLGVGDASGMFPISDGDYDPTLIGRYDALIAERGYPWRLAELLPPVLPAGATAGRLTDDGAALLDPGRTLQAGAVFCPPEGDAGTGMVATNSVAPRTGNVSAGTSIFAMVVLEEPLPGQHDELDLVTTPAGAPVAMVHCNNGASELNSWARVFAEFAAALGHPTPPGDIFEALFTASQQAAPDAGGLLAFNYLSGEHLTGFSQGRPLFVRTPEAEFTLANFVRAQLYATFASLSLGVKTLLDEGVQLDSLYAHGGLFKTRGVGASALANAVNTPVSVGEIAGEGGAWGIAVLARYALEAGTGLELPQYLNEQVFAGARLETVQPDPEQVAGFAAFAQRFVDGFPIEQAAIDHS